MRLNDSFRVAGRTRRVVEVGRCLASDRRQGQAFVTVLHTLNVDDGAAGRCNGTRATLQSPLGEQRDRFAVPNDKAQPFLGIVRVQRDIGIAAFASTENSLDRSKLALEEKADEPRTSSGRGYDLPRNRGCLRIELCEGDLGCSFDDRDIVGHSPRDLRQPDAYRVRHET